MASLPRQTIAEQIAAHLRDGLRDGRWPDALPSIRQIASELDTSKASVQAALRLLEVEGRIVAGEKGRAYRPVARPEVSESRTRNLKVGILLFDRGENDYAPRLLDFTRKLQQAGHTCVVAPKSQSELSYNIRSITRMVSDMKMDAWVVCFAPASLLEWFATQPIPAFACSGALRGLPIAGASFNTDEILGKSLRYLLSLGHRRVVRICNPCYTRPPWSRTTEIFVETLAEAGVTVSNYHLPDWDETPDGLQTVLESLFQFTPPTALIVSDPSYLNGIFSFMLRRGLQIPRDVSLHMLVQSASINWWRPALAHITIDYGSMNRSIVRWVECVNRGRPHRNQKIFPAEFIPGESIGPARR